MFHVVLFQPEIPPNTGNIIRLCANTNSELHLIEPLGFSLDDRNLRRAGLDYHERSSLQLHASLEAFRQKYPENKLYAVSTRGTRTYTNANYKPGDVFLFGPETRGLPQTLLDSLPADSVIRIPMKAGNRSLNLANAAAIIVYEAWRQNDFV
ncbi:MAG: tRNA (uridine(34)/cytosine(34)/5-carboxymethylaminomethyluridine(34)-2'-O)-methyltransferase TrmL [Gammaproteobacteria bacterium]